MSNGPFNGINQRIADRLLAAGRISRDAHQRAVDYATRNKSRIEDTLVDLELMTEADLLKFIATAYSTRFVSTEKLAKAVIDPRLLARVPVATAKLHSVLPVLFDDKAVALSVVTADPDNDGALHEVKLAAAVKEVRALAARPAAVRAGIAFHYYGDANAFAGLLRRPAFADLMNNDPFERAQAQTASTAQSALVNAPATPRQSQVHSPPPVDSRVSSLPQSLPQPPSGVQPPSVSTWAPAQMASTPRSSQPAKVDQGRSPPVSAPGSWPAAEPPPPTSPVAGPQSPPAAVGRGTLSSTALRAVSPPAAPTVAPVASPQFIESLNVLVSLLENSRADLRGHSSAVARLTRKTCERIGVGSTQVAAIVTAAYLHDLGKMGAYHLTALNVSEYEGHRVAALKGADLPVHLMESVGLLPETATTLAAMYERYDGHGLPNGQAAKDIPLGARILAVADTYADLTHNPRNPYRKILRPFEACEVLLQYRGTIFDPNIVDLFRQSTTGEDMRAKLLSDRHLVLIIDPDPEETTVLELRLIEQGFEVKIARTAAQARKLLAEGDIQAVISEIDLDAPDGGLALRDAAVTEGFGRDLTWVMLTGKTDRLAAQRAFDLGVDDFVLKPVSADIFAAKLRQLIERRAAATGSARGVSGSLAEMSLADMVQILWHGRKTCALRIQAQASSGEIDFSEGQVVNARWDALRGEDAFYKMVALREGDFRLDPNFKPTTRIISASPEALLLEGMRRMDEAGL